MIFLVHVDLVKLFIAFFISYFEQVAPKAASGGGTNSLTAERLTAHDARCSFKVRDRCQTSLPSVLKTESG